MKKYIALFLVLVLALFSFAACNKDDQNGQDDNIPGPVEKYDEDKLKETWNDGEITFANGNKILLPCTVKEFVNASGMEIRNAETYNGKQIEPDKILLISLQSENAQVRIDCQNQGSQTIGYEDATVTGFNFYNSYVGNRQIAVSAGLTVGVSRADVEKALGIPEGKTSEDSLYTYKSQTSKGQIMRLVVSFNSDDIVNSISYKLDK